MSESKIVQAVEALAAQYADLSVGSVDHTTNAKAVALKNPEIRNAIASALTDRYRLTSVIPLIGYGSRLDNYVLFFTFNRSDASGLIDCDQKHLEVVVNLPCRAVQSFEFVKEARKLQADEAGVPFVLAVPSRTNEVTTPSSALADSRSREADFFRGLGLLDHLRNILAGAGSSESSTTITETHSYCSVACEYQSPIGSGFTPDTITDTRQDAGQSDDTNYDTKTDHEHSGSLDLPLDRPVIILPGRRSGPGGGVVDPPKPM